MQQIKTLIIDDEANARSAIKNMLLQLGLPVDIVGEAGNASEGLEKIKVDSLEDILGKKFPVLDDGFVRVIDYMGGDESIVQAARVSYGKGTKKVNEDRHLRKMDMW